MRPSRPLIEHVLIIGSVTCGRTGRRESPMQGDQALVLGGGGVAGIAWITGLLTGLAVAGQDVTGADVVMTPDPASAAAIGANPLDPASRVPAAEAGLAQGRGGLVEAG